jgi:hypothetical protein
VNRYDGAHEIAPFDMNNDVFKCGTGIPTESCASGTGLSRHA